MRLLLAIGLAFIAAGLAFAAVPNERPRHAAPPVRHASPRRKPPPLRPPQFVVSFDGSGGERMLAAFTSTDPGGDLARLAAEQDAELLVVATLPTGLLAAAPCDVAVVPGPPAFEPDGPVLVPFGGRRDEWAALELGAWLARAHGMPLKLLGCWASRRTGVTAMRAECSRAPRSRCKRFTGSVAEPALVAPGVDGILAERGAAIVVSLPEGDLDETRSELIERAAVPVLLVRGGLRPGGLSPTQTLTRFSWSLADR